MADSQKDILHLFDFPKTPVFLLKNEEQNVIFDVPLSFIEDRLKPLAEKEPFKPMLTSGPGVSSTNRLKEIKLPDLGTATTVSRYDNFSVFVPKHIKAAGDLIKVFMEAPLDDFKSIAAAVRHLVNPYMFNYALSIVILHRSDTKDLVPPTLAETFPDKFMHGTALLRAHNEARWPEKQREYIDIEKDYTASDLEPEHRVAYFREDLGVNLHHWHWHLIYPTSGPKQIVRKDRRGELFYYMHQQLIARYNFERLCNKLPRVKRYEDWRKPIEEAYFPKLNTSVARRNYAARTENTILKNINREEEGTLDITDLERWRDRIFDAIHARAALLPDGRYKNLGIDSFGRDEGIDILGDIIESSDLSPNTEFYGSLHNNLHNLISLVHDHDGRHLEEPGVMSYTETAMRDPIFYRLHAFIDDMFTKYKESLPSYTPAQLGFESIHIKNVEVEVQNSEENVFHTFWEKSLLNVSKGLDTNHHKGPIYVRLTHLQHEPFSYKITVDNTTWGKRMGICRILLAPKYDEKEKEWLLKDQRLMFVEMDKFFVELKEGPNVIVRKSTDSSVTIPDARYFVDTTKPREDEPISVKDKFNYCGCGWPQHMLLPKGDAGGFKCDLFVIITESGDEMISLQDTLKDSCKKSFSFCGLRDDRYPDKLPMGFPFDRSPPESKKKIKEFLLSNMHLSDVVISYTNKVISHTA